MGPLGLLGPGVAGNGFPDLSLLEIADSQTDPCSGDPFRGDFLFWKGAPIPKTVLRKRDPIPKTVLRKKRPHPENFIWLWYGSVGA